MNVLFIDSCHPFLHEALSRKGFQCHLRYDLDEAGLEKELPLHEGIVIRSKIKLSPALIDKAVNLKFIARVGAGMENIDVSYAESKGIRCFHAPEGNRTAVAEHALGMLLALMNNILRADREVRAGKWIREGNRGYELEGRTVGIIGYGNMGSAFAQRLAGFGVRVLAYDKYKKGFSDAHASESAMQEIFETADVLSLHIPLSAETTYLVNDVFLSNFKKNIFFINTSRGKCVNTEHLVKHIKSGKVLGACLDVLEYESLSFEALDTVSALPAPFQFLQESDRVVLTPHIGGWTFDSNEKMARVLAEKIIASFT
jgi:D-3-phosphoglycerate dehydrogenase / 2-oxoglutarate reductase